MSLTKQDLTDIRGVILDALDVAVNPRLDGIEEEMNQQKIVLDEHTRFHNDHTNRMRLLNDKVDGVDNKLLGIEADVKELYEITKKHTKFLNDKNFDKLSQADKLRQLHAEILALADQLKIEL